MIKEYPDAWKEVLAVGTNREQINLVAPKVVKTIHNCTRYQVWYPGGGRKIAGLYDLHKQLKLSYRPPCVPSCLLLSRIEM